MNIIVIGQKVPDTVYRIYNNFCMTLHEAREGTSSGNQQRENPLSSITILILLCVCVCDRVPRERTRYGSSLFQGLKIHFSASAHTQPDAAAGGIKKFHILY